MERGGPGAWAGMDTGKEVHRAHVLDASGRQLLSRKVENDEAEISRLIDKALSLAEEIVWVVDQPGGGAALLLALLWERDQKVRYVPVSAWTVSAAPTAASPKRMPGTLASSPTRLQ